MSRYLSDTLKEFAREKFILLSGPRQVGKTTLAQSWASSCHRGRSLYLNWDVPENRETFLKYGFLPNQNLEALVLDEIHKYARWKSWLKGLYDREGKRMEVVVTGSARLELFQRSGDSLLGRYESLRLHPLTIGELTHGKLISPPNDWLRLGARNVKGSLWAQLEKNSGFPEPFFKDNALAHRRWSTNRRNLLVHEDLREISQIKQLSLVEHLALILPPRVGSPLSLNSLREELQVAHDTISSWVDALDKLYFCFRISPYYRRITRSLVKERKLYLWDWTQVEDEGARFENMVASHLLKAVHAWSDLGYGEFNLRYIRDKDKTEVDFVITERNRPLALIECKVGDEKPAASLLQMGAQLGSALPLIQLVKKNGVDRLRHNTRVLSASNFLAALP